MGTLSSQVFSLCTVLVTFHIATYRVIVRLLRFNLNVGSERCAIVGVISAVDATARSAKRRICVTINVFTRGLTLLEIRRRCVFSVVFQHLNRHATVDFVLKVK